MGQLNGNAFQMVTPGDQTLTTNGPITDNIGLIAHELGHVLGLYHTFANSTQQVDDLYTPDDQTGPCNNVNISNNIMGYNYCRTYLSPKQIADIRYNIFNSHNSMEKVIETRESTLNKVIISNSNVVWEKQEIIGDTLTIEPGARLTIKCKVNLSKDAKIIVKQGAKLIIDGGILTNEFNDYWQGIEVWGTSNKSQFPESNPTYQGILIIKNGGVIENASTAVTNWKNNDFNSIGGVIQSIDGIFRNNRRDVAFMSYQNTAPNNPNLKIDDYSYFKNTNFISDNNFLEKGLAIQPHVTMWQVKGVNFINCHFSNDVTNKFNSSAPNKGIFTIDAGFRVLSGCSSLTNPCPLSNIQRSSFSGFNTAIDASGAGTTNTTTIQQTDFNNNITGIAINELDNVVINRNNISIGTAGYFMVQPYGYGIKIDNSTGYAIEENDIQTSLTNGNFVGISVNNSGTAANRIYKNSLHNLTYGSTASGINHENNSSQNQTGLQYLCNNFNNNNYGIAISGSSNLDGIRLYQGTTQISAGNYFDHNIPLDMNNSTNSAINYYYKGNSFYNPTSGVVNTYQATQANGCPSSFGGGIVLFAKMNPIKFENLSEQKKLYTDLLFTYNSLIDNGNTNQLLNELNANWSTDAWYTRKQLLASSPFLSEKVLLETAKQKTLPYGMLLEILLKNPDEARGDKFIDKLMQVTDNQFPNEFTEYIRNNWNNKTLRSKIEEQLISLRTNWSRMRDMYLYQQKSNIEVSDSAIAKALNMGDDIYSKIQLMDLFIQKNDFSKAQELKSLITENANNIDSTLLGNYNDYLDFILKIKDKKISELTGSEIDQLKSIANTKTRASGYAQNILCYFYNTCYTDQPIVIEEKSDNRIEINNHDLNAILYQIKLYPNPASKESNLEWEIYDELKNAYYVITDITGRKIEENKIIANKGIARINTDNMTNGVYIISIFNNGYLKSSHKLIINGKQ